jgi:hypothetical protein
VRGGTADAGCRPRHDGTGRVGSHAASQSQAVERSGL